MATDPPADLMLNPIAGDGRTVREWLTTFQLVMVALDPFTIESAWIIPTARRILGNYQQADCRVAWLVTGDADECHQFLGPLASELITFADPDREAIKALGLERVPAIIHLAADGSLAGIAEGWDPPAWRAVTDVLSRMMRWSRPSIPLAGDPAPYPGTPAMG
jgi:hypothetical protein